MAYPTAILLHKKRPTVLPPPPQIYVAKKKPWGRLFNAHLIFSLTGTGGGKGGGAFVHSFILNWTSTGGGKGGGASTISSHLLGDTLLYPLVTSENPNQNADAATSNLPQEYP